MRFLVTDSNCGIGAALLAAATARGHAAIATTRSGGGDTVSFELSDLDSIAAQLQDVPPFDVLINNAGIYGPDWPKVPEMDYAAFAQTFAFNTMAPLAMANVVLPTLRQSASPWILTISSQMSYMGCRNSTKLAYRASKTSENKIMQGLATELEPDGIPVVLVDPGWVRTDMGGMNAEEDPADVTKGIIKIAEKITIADTGKFFRFSGEERNF